MEIVLSARPTGKFPEKVENLKKVGPFSRLEFPNGMSCSIYLSRSLYQFQVHGRASRRTGVYDQMEQPFYQSEIPLLLPPRFPGFFPKWKAPNISSHFCLVAFNFGPVCSVGLRWLLFTWVLKIPYRVKFSPLYQSCPFLTSNLVFQDQRKDKRKHIQCRSIVSSENECRR